MRFLNVSHHTHNHAFWTQKQKNKLCNRFFLKILIYLWISTFQTKLDCSKISWWWMAIYTSLHNFFWKNHPMADGGWPKKTPLPMATIIHQYVRHGNCYCLANEHIIWIDQFILGLPGEESARSQHFWTSYTMISFTIRKILKCLLPHSPCTFLCTIHSSICLYKIPVRNSSMATL